MAYLFLLFPIGIFGTLIYVFVRSQKRLDIEQGLEPLYTHTSGGQIGTFRYRGPFITLRIYDEFIVIGYIKTLVLRYDVIERVEIKKWMGKVPDRIQIIHHQPDVPGKLIIGTAEPDKVKEIIDSRLQKNLTLAGEEN